MLQRTSRDDVIIGVEINFDGVKGGASLIASTNEAV